jgi:CheY-like chemotaxis protein
MDSQLDGIRIVVVENDDDNRELLRTVFVQLGGVVITAATARAALAVAPDADIIVTDYALLDEDGGWLLEAVQGLARPIPVVLVSGFAEGQMPRMEQADFARRLLKPVDPFEVDKVVREVWAHASHGGH